MVKSVNIRLDPNKDKDILAMIEHSKISNVQLFKSLARVAVSNTDISRLGIFDDGFIDVTESNKKEQNVTKSNDDDNQPVTESNKMEQNEDKKLQDVTSEKDMEQNGTEKVQNVTKSNNEHKDKKEDDDSVNDFINSQFSNIQK